MTGYCGNRVRALPPPDVDGTISSRANPRVKAIRKLRLRKERERAELYFVEGTRLVAAAVEAGAAVETLVLAEGWRHAPLARWAVDQALARGAERLTVTAEVFASLAERGDGDGLGAVVRVRSHALPAPANGRLWLALDSVRYPGNLGTLLRASDAVGGAGMILLGHTADPYDTACVRASLGAVFTQTIARADSAQFLAWKSRCGVTVVGASPDAALDYREAPFGERTVLLLGSEREGLSAALREACDVSVRIPMAGRCDSLNVAMAGTVLLYEMLRRQGGPASSTVPALSERDGDAAG